MKYSLLIALLVISGASLAHAADDPSCLRMPCLGKCLSRKDAKGKVFPMYCMQQSTCYEGVDCTLLEDGKCGWKETENLKTCLASKPGGTPGGRMLRPMGPVVPGR